MDDLRPVDDNRIPAGNEGEQAPRPAAMQQTGERVGIRFVIEGLGVRQRLGPGKLEPPLELCPKRLPLPPDVFGSARAQAGRGGSGVRSLEIRVQQRLRRRRRTSGSGGSPALPHAPVRFAQLAGQPLVPRRALLSARQLRLQGLDMQRRWNATSFPPDHILPLHSVQPGVLEVRADPIPLFGEPHHAVLLELLSFVPGDGFFTVPVVLEPLRDRLANLLAQRAITDDAHEVVECRSIFRPQRRGIVAPPLRAIGQCHERDRDAPDRRFELLAVVVIPVAGSMRAQPRLLNGKPHRQRRIPGFGGSHRIAELPLQRQFQLPAPLCSQALGVQVLLRGGLLEQARLPFRRKRGHRADGAPHIPRPPPSTRTRAALTDGVLSGRRGGSSANRPCRERLAVGAVEDAGRVAVAEVDVEASPVT
ncbi:hypothetical protein ACEQ38_07485 [Ralstonia syzygii subsp. celebesensis]|uniref:hypothetical protein n=1 Tax=Ralstonia syzygii TaxID=28097 RepID=UPI0035944585